jgi:hypothetical protein
VGGNGATEQACNQDGAEDRGWRECIEDGTNEREIPEPENRVLGISKFRCSLTATSSSISFMAPSKTMNRITRPLMIHPAQSAVFKTGRG